MTDFPFKKMADDTMELLSSVEEPEKERLSAVLNALGSILIDCGNALDVDMVKELNLESDVARLTDLVEIWFDGLSDVHAGTFLEGMRSGSDMRAWFLARSSQDES